MSEGQVFITHSVKETEEVGAALAAAWCSASDPVSFVGLFGDLGVGKTAFVRGVASTLSPASLVRSPTFALVHEYRGGRIPLFHFDLYRIDSEDDLYSIGFDDYLNRPGICLVEWCEKIPFALPDNYLRVVIEKNDPSDPDCRKITVEKVTTL